jgi:1,4-alpha-glucan branching enzyme
MTASSKKKGKRPSRGRYAETPLQHVVNLRHEAPDAGQVFVAGTFNCWDPTTHPMKRSRNGIWKITIELDRDDHEYKYVVDGVWIHDDLNPDYVINRFGTRNSIFPDA